jgi:ADP-ribose pyrophosphatase
VTEPPDPRTPDPADVPGGQRVVATEPRMHGRVWDVVTDSVELPSGETVVRDVVLHPSAVAVLALDDDDRVLVVHQYRHPVRATLWELPAGLLDVPGEPPWETVRRELWEETNHEAADWAVLVDFLSSPGFCDEAVRIYLAPVAWVPLDRLCAGVLAGRLHNPTMAVGVLAAHAARGSGWSSVRPVDAPWELGPHRGRQSSA